MNSCTTIIIIIALCIVNAEDDICESGVEGCKSNGLTNSILPTTKKELEKSCRILREYEQCLNDWGRRCKSESDWKVMLDVLGEPFGIPSTLCDDHEFQNEYFKEIETIVKIKKRWSRCMTNGDNILSRTKSTEEIVSRMNNLCCTMKKFNQCSDSICDGGKCTQNGTRVVNRLIQIGKKILSVDCNNVKIDMNQCFNDSTRAFYNVTIIIFAMLFLTYTC